MLYVLTLGPFALGYLLSYLLRAVNAVVAPDLVRDIGLDASQLGLLTAAYLFAFAAFQIPLGVLLDRYGPRRVQTVLLVVAAMGSLVFSVSENMVSLTLARAMIGFGFAGGLMSGFKAVVQFVPEDRRALANACVMAFGALGLVLATQPTEMAVAAFGWRPVFAGFAVIIFAAALAVFFVAREGSKPAKINSVGEQLRGVAAVFSNRPFWRIAPVGMLTAGGNIGFQTLWAGPWFRDVAGMSRDGVAGALFLMGVAFLIGIIFSGIVADWFVRRGVSLLHAMSGFLVVYLLSQMPMLMEWTSLALPAWFLFAMTGQAAILAYPWLSSYFGADLSGRAHTAINLLIFAFAFVTQFVVGWIIDFFPLGPGGTYDTRAYQLSFALMISVQLVAFIWYATGVRRLEKLQARSS